MNRQTTRLAPKSGEDVDRDLFPPAFLRLLSVVPSVVKRLRAGTIAGTRAAPGSGGPFLFRGHREYRPGDDLRRVDWGVLARHGRVVVREFDEERDVKTEVWIDGSASIEPFGGWEALARAAALCCAVGLGEGGRVRLGVVRDGNVEPLLDVDGTGAVHGVLIALSAETPSGRAGWAKAMPLLRTRLPRHARILLLSDLLSRADPGALHGFAGRGVRGALLHLRVPEATAPLPGDRWAARDVETGEVREIQWSEALAARVTARATAHSAAWASHAAQVGLAYLPFAPQTPAEFLLRKIALEMP